MKKKSVRKMQLSRETLQTLSVDRLGKAAGGVSTEVRCTNTYHSACCDDSVSCPVTCNLLFSCATC
jgi:hypothetical protein